MWCDSSYINERHNRQKELKLSDSEYSILLVLEEKWRDPKLIDDAGSLFQSLVNSSLLFPGCLQQKAVVKEIEKEVRRFIRKNYVIRYRIGVYKLTSKIIEKLKYHAEEEKLFIKFS